MGCLASVFAGLLSVLRFATLGRAGNIRAAFWIFVATALSGFSTILCKCLSLLAAHAAPRSYLASPYFYTFFLGGAGLSCIMLRCVNVGLQNGDALIVVPMYYALGMFCQIVVAGV